MTESEGYKTRAVGEEFTGQTPPPFKGGKGRKARKRSWNAASGNDGNEELQGDLIKGQSLSEGEDISGTKSVPGQSLSESKDISGTKSVPGQSLSESKDISGTKSVPGQSLSEGEDKSGTKSVPGQNLSESKDKSGTKSVPGQNLSESKDKSGTKSVPGQVKDSGGAGKKSWDDFEAAVFVMQLRKTRKDLTLFLFDRAIDLNGLSTPVIEVKDVLVALKIGESNYKRTAGRLVEQGCFYRTGLTAGGTIYTFYPEIFEALKKLRSRF